MSKHIKIKCRLCDNEYNSKQFGMHISRTHNIPYVEYAIQYWEDLPKWSPCKNCGTVCQATYCTRECFKIGQREFLKNREVAPFTQEHRKNISEAAKERLKDKTKHSRYGVKLSTKTKEKISKSQIKRIKIDGHWATGTAKTEEQKKHQSKMMKGKLVGAKNGMFGKTHTPEAIKKIFSHKPMNKLEKKVADYLDLKNIKYKFQFFINDNGVCKSYDFKLKNSNIIIEVHGDYWHGGAGVKKHHFDVKSTIKNDKLKQRMAKTNGYEVKVLWEHDLNTDLTIIDNLIS